MAMPPDEETCYVALTERNLDYEVVFYVGVRTTGVFCRPTCQARPPRRENCEFFPDAAGAARLLPPVQALSAALASQRDLQRRAPADRCGGARARQALARRGFRRAPHPRIDRAPAVPKTLQGDRILFEGPSEFL
jgi:hypothetical protein